MALLKGEEVMKMTDDHSTKVKRSHAFTPSEGGIEYFHCLGLPALIGEIGFGYPAPDNCGDRPSKTLY
jgi:hypothetical protein